MFVFVDKKLIDLLFHLIPYKLTVDLYIPTQQNLDSELLAVQIILNSVFWSV